MKKEIPTNVTKELINIILKAVALGLSVSTLILNLLGDFNIHTSILLLSISIVCISISALKNN